ncbi:hypothetical protein KUF71_002472 [Frankliniella fusca]|uniref:RNA-directed DNA polymerase n=1 Tax=Frankliniella fusca TaxID=407009 RepID=A0AAE1LL41_9NEOP|nr:hypothetical protein KUF71_002472 [Frankliniella fusca]
MSDLVKAPPPVNLKTGNIQKSWDLFKQKFGFYLIAIGKTKASTEVKCALLMGVAGDDALEVYNAFADKLITYKTNEQNEQVIDTDYSNNYDKVVEQFDLYAAEKKCVTGCRELFNARSQRKGESFQTWLTDIQTLVKDCEYAQISDSMLKDRIIWGTYDKKLREAIRAKARLPLDDIIEICKGAANNARYPGQNDQGDTQEVDAVQVFSGKGRNMHPNNFGIPSSGRGGRGTKGYRGRGRGRFQQTQTRNGSKGEGKNENNSGFNNLFKYKCRKCAKFHEAGNCPAWGQTCGKCGGRNHFKVVCQKASNKPEQAKKVDSLQSVTSQLEGVLLGGWTDNNRYVHMLTVRDTVKRKVIESGWESKRPRKEHTEVLRLQGEHYVKFKLDNGSEVNSLPIHVFEKINKGYKVYPANTLLESYGQVLSKPAGAVELLVETKYGGKLVCEFLLSTVEPKPLLGIEACEKLNLVIKVQHPQDVNSVTVSKFLPESKQDFVKEYMELFTGMGEFQQKVEIVVDPTYQPRMCPARRYHFSIIQKLKPKLDDLERTGVIAKVTDEIPKFVSNMVIREKSNGDLRICLDPEQLNKAILKPRYVIPTFDELACKVKDQEIFTVLDLKWGFWHATLDDKSSMLCTFSTPHGLYRFKKMPFGICSAPETFQFLTEQAFQGTGAIIYFDDCLITGKTYAEHDAKLMKFMQRAKEQNIRFNCDKIQYRQKQVKFLGQLLSKNATKVDPERVRAIQAINEPKTKKQLQKCLGTFNYVRKFLPQMATIAAPLFQPRVEYLPGKYMHIADLLSRQCLGDHVEDDPEMTEVVHEVTKYIPMSETIKADLIKETALDPGLSAVMKYCREGWPLNKNKIEPEAKPYWQIRMDIFVEDNLIILEDRIIVPVKLRKPVLKKLHTAHLGIDKTKARARQSLYWPGMSNDITNFIKECRACERHSANNYREPLIPHEIPSLRFQKVGVDILNFDSKDYLVLEDYLSKWLEVKPLPSKSSKAVIDALRSIFATHGNPQQIFGDNNPLNSSECHEFARSIECDIKTSSPEYARSNGLAEKGVHIAKQMLKKCKDDGTHILDALKEYNNTPLTGLTVSPAQILMSRACRTVIPTLKKHLEPKVVLVKALLKKLQDKVKAQHDLRARRKPVTFQQGDDVVVRRGKKWQKGKIVRRLSENRSYVINLLGGGQLRRNTWHIKHSKTKPDRVDAGGNQIVLDAEEMLANLKAKDSVTRNPRNPLCNFVPAACRTVDAPHTSRFGRRIIQNKKYNDQFLKF